MSSSDLDVDRLAELLADRLAPAVAARLKEVVGLERDSLCDQKEAEAILGISRSSVYRLIDAGIVTRLKVGARNRYDRAELLVVVEAMRRGEIDLSGEAGE
jgi:hypothetical protein